MLLLMPCMANSQISFGGPPPPPVVVESDCKTPHNIEGRCVGLRGCQNIIRLLKRPIPPEVITYLRGSVCGFTGFLPDVCCPAQLPVFGETSPPPPASTETPPKQAVDGGWGKWSPLSQCSVSCGGGKQSRTRSCNNPAPSNGGNDCPGTEKEEVNCATQDCAGVWGSWSGWGPCSVSCGGGEQRRGRECQGTNCEGEAQGVQECGTDPCPTTPSPVQLEIPTDCGQTRAGSVRIVNGKPAKLNAWPWIAALGYDNPNTGKIDYLCGSTLITEKHVITAAHCVTGGHIPVTVLLGEHILHNDTDGADPEEFKVVNIITHEDYSTRTFANDIAIVEFEKGADYKKGIQPACLPFISPSSLLPPNSAEKLVNEGVYIAGWGATGFRKGTSDLLLQGIISVVSEEECKEKFSAFKNVDIDRTKICARDKNDKIDACQGDSGGPLVTLKRAEDLKYRYFLVGVVSFGYRCAVKGFPGVYTRVSEYEDWIKSTVNK